MGDIFHVNLFHVKLHTKTGLTDGGPEFVRLFFTRAALCRGVVSTVLKDYHDAPLVHHELLGGELKAFHVEALQVFEEFVERRLTVARDDIVFKLSQLLLGAIRGLNLDESSRLYATCS